MTRILLPSALVALLLSVSDRLGADEPKYVVKDGITYRETRQVIRRPIVETRLEPREYTAYREKYTTEIQETQRTIQSPVTEYNWVQTVERSWNPFNPPYVAYRMVPTTRWEAKTETVRVPITRRELVPEKQTRQIPVTTQRYAEDEIVTRVAVSTQPPKAPVASGAIVSGAESTAVARRDPEVGGVSKLDSDPPRQSSTWRPAGAAATR